MAPKVSVLVPCYDLGAYLDEAVESVLAQTLQDFEILVVDDASSDPATRALLDGYERPKTRVLRIAHAGLAGARNFALENASGEYVCALDADDRLEPTYFDKAVAVLDADPGVTFVSSWLRAFGEEEWLWKQERCDLAALLAEDTVHTAALVRRAALVAAGGWDGAMGAPGNEDWDLWIGLVERGARGVILPEVLFHYRRRAGSMSTFCTRGDAHLGAFRYMVAKHAQSYRTHLFDVLRLKEEEVGSLLRSNDALERRIGTVEADVGRRREELAGLHRRLEALRRRTEDRDERDRLAARLEELERRLQERGREIGEYAAALANAERAASELKTSRSWTITAPLRAVHAWLTRRRGA